MKVALIGCSGRAGKIIEPLEAVGVKCIVVDNPFRRLNDVDIIVTDTPGMGIVKGWLLKTLNRKRLVFRVRGNYWQEIKSENKFYKIREFINDKILLRLCDRVVTVNYYLRKVMHEHGIRNVDVVGVPVSNEFVKESIHEGKKKEYFTIVTLTNFNYFEKIKPILHYAKTVNDFLESVNGKWLIAGRGKYVKYFLDKIQNYRNIIYCGYVKSIDFLKKGDVMLHLSEFEGLPNAILEGLLSGLPVIVNDFDPLKEIEHVIVIRDEKELIKFLWYLYKNPKIIRKIGLKSKKYILKKYNLYIIGYKLKDIFSNYI